MATYIIADLHLSESKPILTNAFANFYDNNLYLNDKMIIAGDMSEYFGMKLIGDFYIIPTPDGQALLIHGDQLCLHDRSYQKFRTMSKNKIIRFVFMALPLSWRKKIALKIRKKIKVMP